MKHKKERFNDPLFQEAYLELEAASKALQTLAEKHHVHFHPKTQQGQNVFDRWNDAVNKFVWQDISDAIKETEA